MQNNIYILALMLIISAPWVSGLSTPESSNRGGGDRNLSGKTRSIPKLSSMTATAESQESQEISRSKRRRKSLGAPLVDSSLLRFVSEQKREQQYQLKKLEKLKVGSSYSSIPSLFNDDEIDPWMGQYNRNRIAQKLISLGSDESPAMLAGEKIQNYVLVRTTRRRIRLFLKERDSLWNKSSEQTTPNSSKLLAEQLPHPTYGFDEVVEVFLDNGFTGKDISAILSHSPNLVLMMPRKASVGDEGTADDFSLEDDSKSLTSGETLEQTVWRSFNGLLLTTLGLRKYDARKVLRNCPGLLSVRGSKSAVQIVAMMTKLGVSPSSLARNKKTLPRLLSRAPADMFRLISFLSSSDIRIPVNSIGPLLRRTVSRDLLDAVAPVPKLENDESSKLSSNDAINPKLEPTSWGKTRAERTKKITDTYRNMTKTAAILRNEIGAKELGKVVSGFPSVLLLDAENQILPVADYLIDEIGISDGDLPRVLQLYPTLVGEDIDEMKRTVSFLVSVGVEEEDIGSICRAFPKVLNMKVSEMMPVIDYLKSIGVNNVGEFITRLPPVLGYSVENDLKPKWMFLKKACMHPNFEVNKFPAYFSYPFERVIKTRYDYLAAKGIARQLVPVDAVLRFGDVDFATRVARDEDGGKVFLKFSERRKNVGGKKKKKNLPPKSKSPLLPPM